jgi:glyceraldehyde 3-phosphate dehydrogenase
MLRIAINGMGRIGRALFKVVLENPEFKLAAVNDLMPVENLVYLLRYDTVYGRYGKAVEEVSGDLRVDGVEYKYLKEKDPASLPWKEMGIDLVFECTGVFESAEDLARHLHAGARYVLLSAPSKSKEVATVVYGVNAAPEGEKAISCASCTTNAITPVVEVLGRRIGIRKAVMSTIHAYTATQHIVDGPTKGFRRGRAGAANLVPTSTGAAKTTTRVLTQYAGKFDGAAIRAPLAVGSLADMVLLADRATSVEEVNGILREEAASERYAGVLGVTDDRIVSSDIIKDPHASVVDLGMTQVVDGDLVKVMTWYDNEWGYVHQLVREALRIERESRHG